MLLCDLDVELPFVEDELVFRREFLKALALPGFNLEDADLHSVPGAEPADARL